MIAAVVVVVSSVLFQRFSEYWFHRLFHTRLFRQAHLVNGHHHRPRRRDTEVQLTLTNLGVISVISVAEHSLGLGWGLIVTGGVGNLLSCWFAFWVHRASHAPASVLGKFPWFQRVRELHGIHHNKCSHLNFSISYPFWFDRMFRTYSAPHGQ